MSLIDDEGTDGSCFVWTIQNYSYCLKNPGGDCLESPTIILNNDETCIWRLNLCTRFYPADTKTIIFRLCIDENATSYGIPDYVLSIRTESGSFKTIVEDRNYDLTSYLASGQSKFLKRENLRREVGGISLNNDSLTLRCRIRKLYNALLPPIQCHMRTIINVEKTTSTWSLEKLRQNASSSELTINLPTSLELQSLIAVKLLLCRDSFSGDGIKLEIKQIDKDKPCFFTCDMFLFEDGGKVVHSMREEHMFEASEVLNVWTLPYALPNKICDFKNTYLSCELAVSSGIVAFSGIENTWVERFGIDETDAFQHPRSNLKEQNVDDSWKDDLERFYSSGKFTDFIIRTPSKEFPVHKAILCARSTVFEQGMKENRTGVVQIKDIDADIIHKMLMFVYSDVVGDLDWDVACKLYFAADRFRITALRERCLDFIKENLRVSNVCEMLVFANVHQFEVLKSFVQDFIADHAAEVMRSVEWKTLMKDQVPLASEIMHMLMLQNS